VGFVFPDWRYGTAAVTLRHFGVGGIEGRDDRNVVTDDDLSDGETEFTLSYARQWGDALGVGATGKLHRQNLAGYSGSAFGFDLGFLVRPAAFLPARYPWAENLRLGLSFRNLVDSAMQLDVDRIKDPSTARAGLAYTVPMSPTRSVLIALDVEKGPNIDTGLHLGLEARVHPLLSWRMGLNGAGFTAGAGVHWRDASFDYTFEDNRFDSVHRLGLAWSFGATTGESRLAALRRDEEALRIRLDAAFARREAQHMAELLTEAEKARKAGDTDGALDLAAVILTLSPGNEQGTALQVACLLDKARALESGETFAEAAVVYGQAQSLDPENGDAVSGSARCRTLSDERAARSQTIRALFAEALRALSAGELAGARDGFRKILEVNPEDEEAAVLLQRTEITIDNRVVSLLDQTDRFIDAGLLDEAAATLEAAAGFGNEGSRLRRVQSALARARRMAAAGNTPAPTPYKPAGTADASPTLKPGEIEDLYKRGMAAMEAGQTSDALHYWELVVSADPDYQQVKDYLKQEYLARGMDSFAEGRLERAIDSWEKALRIDPDDGKVQGYLARAREQLSRTREILGTTGQ
jgi:tetratricopeptide (TPR) repeat protein